MKLRRLLPLVLCVFPVALPAASREIQELQRDVAQLQQDLKTLQRAFDEKIPSLAVLVQQTLDLTKDTNKALNSLEGRVQEQLRTQGKEVAAPVAGLSTKIDQMSADFTSVRESVSDITARMGKLEQQILDLSNAVRTMQTPAPPPPGTTGQSPAGSGSPAASPAAAPPADILYQNALRDKTGGKDDLALQEFGEYLKYYATSSYAPNAQFYIGEIHFKQGDYEAALQDFDMVLEKYPANNKTPDARYMKGQTLVKLSRRTAGAAEFRALIRQYPNTDLAAKAQRELKQLGLSPSTARRK
jgi:tol-pal system protein YbgF